MAVCHVCVGVLDAVVTEWRRGALPDDEGAVCVACGAPAQLWVSPTQPPPPVVIAVDLTGSVLRIEVSGSLGADAGSIVARELVALSTRGDPVVIDLREVTALDAAAERELVAAVRAALAAGVSVGIVTPGGSRWPRRRFAGRSVIVGESLEAVVDEITQRSRV